ncbi:hypothetical protein [Oxynema aestuarii]|uniref:Uncharacterized protein n=1 Tax=Oxynema aestuarii AP17 TaxID=2064643 RepID=A0A6H1TSA2_9CYAN|nr:hypothetical protein [Oxynema aestuarii]QIZ69325.1 hypothetical protein HCG48_00915 [Oxynema aestuarii AP17]
MGKSGTEWGGPTDRERLEDKVILQPIDMTRSRPGEFTRIAEAIDRRSVGSS